MISRLTAIAVALAALFASGTPARSESWPLMDNSVPRCGMIVHARADGGSDRTLCEVEEFKVLVTRIVEDIASGIASETPPQAPRAPHNAIDLAGEWRMLLPAGFEHRVALTRVADNAYRLTPGGLNSSGVYELRDDTLTITAPDELRMTGFTWKVNSRHLLTLVEQASNTGADYLGAVLFRPRDLEK